MAKPRKIKQQILDFREQGLSYNSIQKILSCSKATINYHCKRYDLTDIGMKNHKVQADTVDAIKLFCETNNIPKAMKHFALSRSTIKKYKKPLIIK